MNVGGVRFLKLPEVEHICLFPMAQFVKLLGMVHLISFNKVQGLSHQA